MRLKAKLSTFLSTACLFWHLQLCSASDSLLERHEESDVSDSKGPTFQLPRSRGLKSKGGKTYEEAGYYRPSYMYQRPHLPDYGGGYAEYGGYYGGYGGYGGYYGGYDYGNGSKKSKAYQQYPIYNTKSQKKSKKYYDYVVSNPQPPPAREEAAGTIYEIINQIVNLSTLASLVNSPGQEKVVQTLDGEGPVTLFAPLNSAFDELFQTLDPSSLTDEELSSALNYHIVAGRLRKRLLIVGQQGILYALNGDTISYKANGREVTLNKEALIVKGNIRATNGLIQVIDAVLLPAAASETVPTETIAAQLEAAGNFNTLLELLSATDLLRFIEDPDAGPYTLFAPTDAAFNAYLAETGYTIPQLITDFDLLTSILLYETVDGVYTTSDLADINSLETLEGENIAVDGTTLNSDTEIIDADILASNGIIQVVDKVLVPPSKEGAATPPPTSGGNTTPTPPPTRNNAGSPTPRPTTAAPATSGPTVAGTPSPTAVGNAGTSAPTVAGGGGTPSPTVTGGSSAPSVAGGGGTPSPTVTGGSSAPSVAGGGGTPSPTVTGGSSAPSVAGGGGTPSPTATGNANSTAAPTAAVTSTGGNSTNTTNVLNGTSTAARAENIQL